MARDRSPLSPNLDRYQIGFPDSKHQLQLLAPAGEMQSPLQLPGWRLEPQLQDPAGGTHSRRMCLPRQHQSMAASIVTQEIRTFPATLRASQTMVRPFLDFQAFAKAEKGERREDFRGRRSRRMHTHPATEERKRKKNHHILHAIQV